MSEPSATPRDALAASPRVLSDAASSGVDPDASSIVAPARLAGPPAVPAPAIDLYAKEHGLTAEQVTKKESLYRRVLTQLGFAADEARLAPAFQLQYTWDKNNPSFGGKRIAFDAASTLGRYFTLELDRVQFNTKLEFASQAEYITSTVRFETSTKIVPQLNFEFRPMGYESARPADGIAWEGIKVIANLDSLPKPRGADPHGLRSLAGIPGLRGYQFGVALSGSFYGVKVVYEDLVIIDFSVFNPDPKKLAEGVRRFDASRLASLGQNFQVTVPLDVLPRVKGLAEQLGGRWSVTAKVFLRVYATAEAWARAAGVLAQAATGGAAAVSTAVTQSVAAIQAVAEAVGTALDGEALVTLTPTLAVAGALAATAAAVTVAGILSIRDRLDSGRDSAVLNSYISGYAEELAGAVQNPSSWLVAEIEKLAMLDFRVALEEISAHVHGRKPAQVYRLPACDANAVSFALALNRGAVDLGRAAVIIGIYGLIQKDGVQAWLRVRQLQQSHLADRRARGDTVTLKSSYAAALTRLATDTTIGLPLRTLDQIF